MSLLVPTPPTSPQHAGRAGGAGAADAHSSNSSSDSCSSGGGSHSRRGSINAARRKSLLVESQLNALLPHAHAQQTGGELASASAAIASAGDSIASASAGGGVHGLEPQQPLPVPPSSAAAATSHLPVSEPMAVVPVTARPRSRRNSWVAEAAASSAASAAAASELGTNADSVPSIATEVTFVEALSPSALPGPSPPVPAPLPSPVEDSMPSGPVSRDGDHPVFTSPEAAEKYSRMLRRASWPVPADIAQLLPEGAIAASLAHGDHARTSSEDAAAQIYMPTPAVSPRRLKKAAVVSAPPSPSQLASSASFDPSPPQAAAVPSTAAFSPPASLVNLLLLGDDSVGLGDALDAFAGRDQGVGITFKTRNIFVPQRGASSSSATGGASASDDVMYRVRCWHTPGLTPENARTMAPYLRHVQAVALIYDVTSPASFHACERWATRLQTHHASISPASSPPLLRPVLLVGNTALSNRLAPHTGIMPPAHTRPIQSMDDAPEDNIQPLDALDAAVPPVPASVSPPSTAATSASSSSPRPGNTSSPALSRLSARRLSQQPHAHMPHVAGQDGAVAAVPLLSIPSADSSIHGSSSSAAAVAMASSPSAGIAPSQVSALLQRLSSPSSGFGAASALRVNANLWRERYRVFAQVASMVHALGPTAAANTSRPVSPVHA